MVYPSNFMMIRLIVPKSGEPVLRAVYPCIYKVLDSWLFGILPSTVSSWLSPLPPTIIVSIIHLRQIRIFVSPRGVSRIGQKKESYLGTHWTSILGILQNKALFYQNNGHLGSRYMYTNMYHPMGSPSDMDTVNSFRKLQRNMTTPQVGKSNEGPIYMLKL